MADCRVVLQFQEFAYLNYELTILNATLLDLILDFMSKDPSLFFLPKFL